jgi:hypothetical protein
MIPCSIRLHGVGGKDEGFEFEREIFSSLSLLEFATEESKLLSCQF